MFEVIPVVQDLRLLASPERIRIRSYNAKALADFNRLKLRRILVPCATRNAVASVQIACDRKFLPCAPVDADENIRVPAKEK